jgi:hypothetical protein
MMNRSTLLVVLLATALLLSSACASNTPTTVPSATATPLPQSTATPLPAPTATPLSDSTPSPCRAGSEAYTDSTIGFSACYPSGWQISGFEDPESKTQGVDFVSPTDDTHPVPNYISVRVAPIDSDESEEKILEQFAISLMNRRSATGQPVVPIAAVLIDGHSAAQDTLTNVTFVEGQQVGLTGWIAGFPAQRRMWYITVTGPTEQQMDLEDIYQEFASQFHLLP